MEDDWLTLWGWGNGQGTACLNILALNGYRFDLVVVGEFFGLVVEFKGILTPSGPETLDSLGKFVGLAIAVKARR